MNPPSRPAVIFVNVQNDDFETATSTFLELLCQPQEVDTSSSLVESPSPRCARLEAIESRLDGEHHVYRRFGRGVRRRINFNDPSDKDWEEKMAALRLLVISTRTTQRQQKTDTKEIEKKRKRDYDDDEVEQKPKKVFRKTPAPFRMRKSRQM